MFCSITESPQKLIQLRCGVVNGNALISYLNPSEFVLKLPFNFRSKIPSLNSYSNRIFSGKKKEKTERMQDHGNLISRSVNGDRSAMEELYNRNFKIVFRIAYRMYPDTGVAEEIANDTFVTAFKKLKSLKNEKAFQSWVIGIAVNLTRNRIRKDKYYFNENELNEAITEEANAGKHSLQIDIQQALQSLPEGYQKVIILHDIEGFTHEEIGQILGLRTGTSKSQLYKARKRMRKILSEKIDENTNLKAKEGEER